MALSDSLHHLVRLLKKPSELRSPEEIDILMQATENVKFFKNQTREVHWECCRVMHVEEFREREEIFKYGDLGANFYIILEGEVQVLAPKLSGRHSHQVEATPPLDDSQALKNAKKTTVICLPFPSVATLVPPPDTNTSLNPPESPLLAEVAVLSAGSSFGELALLYDQPRAATILTAAHTILAVLSHTNFNRILRESVGKAMAQKAEFLRSIDVLSRWRQQHLIKLSYHCHEQTVCHRHTVYREGDTADKVFLIVEGEFMVRDRQFTKNVEGRKGGTPREMQVIIKGRREMFGDREDFLRRIGSGELLRQLKQRHTLEAQWLKERLRALSDFDPDRSPSPLPQTVSPISPSDKVIQYILSPVNPVLSLSPAKKPSPQRSFFQLSKQAHTLQSSQLVSKWRSVRLNDMILPCLPQKSFVISPMRRSRTPTNFLHRKEIQPKEKHRHQEPIWDAYEVRYEKEAELFAEKYREKLAASTHSAFRYTKRSSKEFGTGSRPASRLSPAKSGLVSSP